MFPPASGLLVAALCAARASSGDDLADLSVRLPVEVVEQALPAPPDKVVLKTSYYGTVTVDHTAHLARKARCRDCHGAGPVTNISFTPKLAHERCRGCHAEAQKGPTDCKGCHILPPKEPGTLAIEATPAAGPAAQAQGKVEGNSDGKAGGQLTAEAGAPNPEAKGAPEAPATGAATPETPSGATGWHTIIATPVGPMAGSAAVEPAGAPIAVVVSSAPLPEPALESKELHRSIQAGAAGGEGFGISARITSRQGRIFLAQGLDRLSGQSSTRTAVLLGAGAQLPVPLPRPFQLQAEGVVGLDAVERPLVHLMPALGARIGMEWTPDWSRRFNVLFSVTGLLDLARGDLASRGFLYATIVVGVPLQRL
jgi:hypothetical protein